MQTHSERGSGRLSGLLWLLILIAVIYAAWNVVPVYIKRGNLQDKMIELARSDRTFTDDEIMGRLMKEVEAQGLQGYIGANSCRLVTREHSRQITCDYEHKTKVLPGYTRVFRFNLKADQPLI
jgi:hypothetical protein